MVSHIPQIFIIRDEILIKICMDDIAVMVSLINQVAYVAIHISRGNIIRHLNIPRMNSGTDLSALRINDLSGRICYTAVFQTSASFNDFRNTGIQNLSVELKTMIAVDVDHKVVGIVLRDHDVNIIRIDLHSDILTDFRCSDGLNDHLILARFNDDLIVNSLENNGSHRSADRTFLRSCNDDILRPHDSCDQSAFFNIIDAFKFASAKARF